MKDILKTTFRDFHSRLPIPSITPRDLGIPLQSDQIITIAGTRRCGKTFFFYSMINELISTGTDSSQILYFNFEDERFRFQSGDLQIMLDAYFELYPGNIDKKLYFFFDEIQEVQDWEKFIRRIKDTLNPYIFLTGSSSKMLSTEIASALRGRSITFNLYPFSFAEYCRHNDISTSDLESTRTRTYLAAFFQEYLIQGGFPETINQPESIRLKILQSYFDVMIFRDIIERYQVSNHVALKMFIRQLTSTVSSEFSINKIYNDLKSNMIKVSKNQLYNFLSYTQDCFLFFVHQQFEYSPRKSLQNSKKIYFIDNGLLANISFSLNDNQGKLLENLIFMELIRREKEIYFAKNGMECDFLIMGKNGIAQLIQVSYDLSNEQTLQREIKPLLRLSEKNPAAELMLISNYTEKTIEQNGKQIKVIPAWKWCLSK
ncbi:MAG: ATP-binding protein [Candidatus Cloacimonadales bacterium]|nr:ATP-binding protein [Candidatus Cloacimonadales bacterium]